ncbi:YcnI family protein [Microlunatus soli]|uniref:Uncharacterized protein YcnI n=1 Tax=Microlunatus soli TaxID=630515 RepID=A0A1H1MUC8_9ACTN|nr:YcnI family protein [Microlunatus soli]SDR90192.1 Uncharacterized protein YcnI [Microlunatus soli]
MIRRSATAVLLAALLGLLMMPTAAAHVRVSSTDAAQGGYGVLTFRVPTESDTASTVGLTVTLPEDTPLASVSVQPVPGWTATRKEQKLDKPIETDDGTLTSYVSSVTWKADSDKNGLKPGEFGLFSISAGPLPEKAQLAFPATQRYSDGSTVAWDEITTGGGAEPEHPAPAIELPAAAAPSPTASAPPPTKSGSQDSAAADGSTGWLAPTGAVLAAIAVIIAVAALLRSRRSA